LVFNGFKLLWLARQACLKMVLGVGGWVGGASPHVILEYAWQLFRLARQAYLKMAWGWVGGASGRASQPQKFKTIENKAEPTNAYVVRRLCFVFNGF
jgi:hypothetical protein